jgi:hypothetical protein
MPEAEQTVFAALDAMKRRAVADVFNHIAELGWLLTNPATHARVDPAKVAQLVLERHSEPLVGAGDPRTVGPVTSPNPPERDDPDEDPDEDVPEVR